MEKPIECDDAISRQSVLDAISRIGLCKCSTNEIQTVDECRRAVEVLPPVTQKSGKWLIKDRYYHDTVTAECSECHREVEIPTCMEELMYDYCPNCGARMESDNNE